MKDFLWEILIPGMILGAMTAGLIYIAVGDRCEDVPEIQGMR